MLCLLRLSYPRNGRTVLEKLPTLQKTARMILALLLLQETTEGTLAASTTHVEVRKAAIQDHNISMVTSPFELFLGSLGSRRILASPRV
jgi:hypothetical protein